MALSKGAGEAPLRTKTHTIAGASEADIATNKALLFHAEAARLAKSWLRGTTTTGDGRDEDEKEDQAEEDLEREFLRNKDLYSETGGIGYHPPTESTSSTAATPGFTDPATTFLRKQLLRGHQRGGRATTGNAHNHSAGGARPRPQIQASRRVKGEEVSDEEESRSKGVGKRKRKGNIVQAAVESDDAAAAKSAPQTDQMETEHLSEKAGAISTPSQSHGGETDRTVHAPEPSTTPAIPPKTSRKRGAGSYLDELLASRAAKKQKKKNKHKGKSLAESEPG
ncbi:uncharacterized protein Z520_03447 [Fonsecaea multimorphosa CBS 102226]|uniref:Uncharacterized protein n=1 Tax=Fonsecaea multimorphosa CBS 102226 TaxID=1442371 RepID=A0A0D2IUP9_9EURO|nr:uncharacterized protein Z520_03447 [Fonsecaea multimorphosa CBS 102226]KIY00782.1 hypothetical protein Z520_03447 [Fonsecaea multimorphosa CBS 102226]OAL27881.1 hypothetical protein AYO22_03226 [Fonsecaea multimorphosa]